MSTNKPCSETAISGEICAQGLGAEDQFSLLFHLKWCTRVRFQTQCVIIADRIRLETKILWCQFCEGPFWFLFHSAFLTQRTGLLKPPVSWFYSQYVHLICSFKRACIHNKFKFALFCCYINGYSLKRGAFQISSFYSYLYIFHSRPLGKNNYFSKQSLQMSVSSLIQQWVWKPDSGGWCIAKIEIASVQAATVREAREIFLWKKIV